MDAMKRSGSELRLGYPELLKRSREERGLSIRQVADRSGVGRSTISRWERGGASPNGPELIAVLRCLEPSSPLSTATPSTDLPSGFDHRLRGERLREARHRSGLSLEAVAVLVGVSKAALSRWETGDRQPAPEKAERLARVLGLSEAAQNERPTELDSWVDWLSDCVYTHQSRCLDLDFLALDAVLRTKTPRPSHGPDLLAKVRTSYVHWLGWWYRDREAATWATFELRDRPAGWDDPGIGRLLRARANFLFEFGEGSKAAAKLLDKAAQALEGRSAHGFVLREFAGHLSNCGYHAEAFAVVERARSARLGDESEATHQICCDLVESTIWLQQGQPDRAYRSLPNWYPEDDMLRLSGASTTVRCLAKLGAVAEAKRKLSEQIVLFRSKGFDHFATTLNKELATIAA